QFQTYRQTSFGNVKVGKHRIAYDPVASCGSSVVDVQNLATAGLYNYTPYQPNQAALDAGYGSSSDPCSSYGNRNFFLYYTDWFGNPGNLLQNASFEGSKAGWGSGVKSVG